MTDDPFGFTAARKPTTADKLKKFAPSADNSRSEPVAIERADAAGAALGFVPRENTRATVLRKRKDIGPTVAINMRVPEAVAARFIKFCEEHRLSYWEGVEELMKRNGIT
ncbi:hypothetical protein [Muricoccus nepalensis]|jgi:hypothetical protein|uniref:hypothetical protein n=1 Tax=Muricoccus nepalensis TaxID=1854500 RepID=UPI00112CE706|nr:hypothetical protein [Roseomonas nepalensis]